MRFSVYSEIQYHGGKPYRQLYDEVLEQIEHADRVGFDVYAIIEHWFFPRFSISANPWALFGMATERTRSSGTRVISWIDSTAPSDETQRRERIRSRSAWRAHSIEEIGARSSSPATSCAFSSVGTPLTSSTSWSSR